MGVYQLTVHLDSDAEETFDEFEAANDEAACDRVRREIRLAGMRGYDDPAPWVLERYDEPDTGVKSVVLSDPPGMTL